MTWPLRYRVQQDKGAYALKACDDGDLVDWSEYEALRNVLLDIASGEMGVNVCIKHAKRALRIADQPGAVQP